MSTKTGTSRRFEANVEGGVVGILIDARGRPIDIPKDDDTRIKKLREWFSVLEAYPKSILEK